VPVQSALCRAVVLLVKPHEAPFSRSVQGARPAALLLCCRAAERASVMRQRVSAIEEREQQRRIRMESLGKHASTAGGPDMGAFMSQLENKGYAGAQQQQQQPAGDRSSSTGQSKS
jgi:hypothetical protein